MKFKYIGTDERVFVTLGLTVKPDDVFEAPDDFAHLNVVPVDSVKTKSNKIAFNPNAKDGDKDGFVQDGTEHERPATPKAGE